MAKDNGNGTVTVQKGDTLWDISKVYLKDATKYQSLAKLNNISNPNHIYVGQVIKLWKTAGSSGSSSSNKNPNQVEITGFGVLASSDDTLFATWKFGKVSQTSSYEIEWSYDLGDGFWYYSSSSNTISEHNEATSRYATFSIPAGSHRVRLRIKPISKEETDSKTNKKKVHYTGQWCGYKTYWDSTPVETPSSAPSISIEKLKLTTELENISNNKLTHVQFQIYKDNKHFKTSGKIAITATGSALYSCNVNPGSEYKVRYRAYIGGFVSDYSPFSSGTNSIPSAPSGIKTIKATSDTSIYLEWPTVKVAKTYDIEYTTEERYFDGSDKTTTKTGIEFNHFELTGLESGDQYFFRIRAVDDQNNTSEWSKISSITIGKKPAAPTTWSSTTTVIVGEPLTLYWVHNTVDGSSQEVAELELTINGSLQVPAITIKNTKDENEKDKTSFYSIDTSNFTYIDKDNHLVNISAGAKIEWRVRTAGIAGGYGDWSVLRTVDVYAPPTVSVSVSKRKDDYENTPIWFYTHEPTASNLPASEWTTTELKNQHIGDLFYIIGDGTNSDQVYTWTLSGGVYGWELVEDSDITDTTESIETLTSFPFYIYALPGLTSQIPIGYHLSITANQSYETTDQTGNEVVVNRGGEVYSKYFDISDSLLVGFTPGNIDLQNGIEYTAKCTVTMNSGLTAEDSAVFSVSWEDEVYSPNAEITYDGEKYVTHIRPYCESHETTYNIVSRSNSTDTFTVTTEILDIDTVEDVYTNTGEIVYVGKDSKGGLLRYCIVYTDTDGNPIDPIYYKVSTDSSGNHLQGSKISESSIYPANTTTGERVLLGIKTDSSYFYYSEVNKTTLIEDVTLSVYRREYTGEFTEIMTGITNMRQTVVTDPHPALDYARYRIVAISNITGSVSYYDLPGFPISEPAVIIQWDEVWSNFDTTVDAEMVDPPWSGSLLRLPYNIDVSDNNSPDVTLAKYFGRKRPVSYYGTHLGESSSWSVTVPKEDKETLYGLRRLSLWMGDVYVREPSGSGYWANITVSFSQKHCDTTIPVSFSVTRVEGGI